MKIKLAMTSYHVWAVKTRYLKPYNKGKIELALYIIWKIGLYTVLMFCIMCTVCCLFYEINLKEPSQPIENILEYEKWITNLKPLERILSSEVLKDTENYPLLCSSNLLF